ncbi:uncharacterized protein LOC123684223 [Harmonia axyridis]|uniref:uncharacterized protein LOC123684223 n=1 Tax=Harmonia axyridis TaxID=115357 RepID=UPI001E279C84|nr:uncharacterized protein LOC123684223 [Harmonia axyridis]
MQLMKTSLFFHLLVQLKDDSGEEAVYKIGVLKLRVIQYDLKIFETTNMYRIVIFACALAAATAAPGLIGAPLALGPAPLALSSPLLTKTIISAPSPIAIQAPLLTRTVISSPPALAIAPQPILTKSILAGPAVASLPLGLGLSKTIIGAPAISAGHLW